MKPLFVALFLPADIGLPAAAQESQWRISAQAGIPIIGVGNARLLPTGESLNNGYT